MTALTTFRDQKQFGFGRMLQTFVLVLELLVDAGRRGNPGLPVHLGHPEPPAL